MSEKPRVTSIAGSDLCEESFKIEIKGPCLDARIACVNADSGEVVH